MKASVSTTAILSESRKTVTMSSDPESEFQNFYTEVKEIEKRDSVLTPKQQIERLLRPGSSYFNLNPFEVSDQTRIDITHEGTNSSEQCHLNTHLFSALILDTTIYYFVISLKDSFFLWIGNNPDFGNLSIAVHTRFDDMPIASTISGSRGSISCSGLAARLVKHTGKIAFVTSSIKSEDPNLFLLVEKHLIQEIKSNPDKF